MPLRIQYAYNKNNKSIVSSVLKTVYIAPHMHIRPNTEKHFKLNLFTVLNI